MLIDNGDIVFHYGTEGSNPVCTENIDVLSAATFDRVHGAYDWKKQNFVVDVENDAYKEFTSGAIAEIGKRFQDRDFILCTFGVMNKPIVDAFPRAICVEPGIGYENTLGPLVHRVFESNPWMHYIYGKEGRMLNPSFYDAVIPNYYDLDDYKYEPDGGDCFLFLGRPTPLKGLEIAQECAKVAGVDLYIAGQGEYKNLPSFVKHLGVLSIEERSKWMGGAKCVLAPTIYIEPFGGVPIEALLCGTPVITTDFGAFVETIPHGLVGYRCRSLEQFHWAAKNIGNIDRGTCREYAERNYSIGRVRKKYREYFSTLARLYADPMGWYGSNDGRDELDWLRAY